jgi:hypothetical protein
MSLKAEDSMAQGDSKTQADDNVRQVFDSWRNKIADGGADGCAPSWVWASLHPDFQYLLELAFQYDDVRRQAIAQRASGIAAASETQIEGRAKMLFMTAYQCFMETHPGQMEH